MAKKNQTADPSRLYFSAIYGDGLYTWDGRTASDPFGQEDSGSAVSPLFTNLVTGELFFARRLAGDPAALAHFRELVLHPADREHILWPADLIALPADMAGSCSLFTAHDYRAEPVDRSDNCHALLFPYLGWPILISGAQRLKDLAPLSWQDPRTRALAAALLTAVEGVNRSGYLYCDLHPSRFFFREDGQALLDFSNLIFPMAPLLSPQAPPFAPAEGEYPVEFAEPAYVNGRVGRGLDLRSQNYSLTALLFYLFFGRHPYDGRLLDGAADGDPYSHYAKFQKYHDMPIFLFDPEDTQNALGAFAHERELVELWRELPPPLQTLFTTHLSRASALRLGDTEPPTAGELLTAISSAPWPHTPSGKEDLL